MFVMKKCRGVLSNSMPDVSQMFSMLKVSSTFGASAWLSSTVATLDWIHLGGGFVELLWPETSWSRFGWLFVLHRIYRSRCQGGATCSNLLRLWHHLLPRDDCATGRLSLDLYSCFSQGMLPGRCHRFWGDVLGACFRWHVWRSCEADPEAIVVHCGSNSFTCGDSAWTAGHVMM